MMWLNIKGSKPEMYGFQVTGWLDTPFLSYCCSEEEDYNHVASSQF